MTHDLIVVMTHPATAPPVRELVYAAIGLISVALYYKGAGGGNAQRENLNTLKAYTLVAMAYLALTTLAAFQYHVMWDDKHRYHHVYATKLAPSMGLNAGGWLSVCGDRSSKAHRLPHVCCRAG